MESKREKVLLVGNGINRIGNQTVSWEDLLNNLKRHIHSGRNVDLSNEFKPFPLAFEEIVFYKLRPYEESTKVLKDSIAETITRLAPNDVHKQIMECRIKHIMTTNYDYSLEKALNPSFKMNDRNLTSTNEEKHSIFRKYKLKDKTIWHLHGESKDDKYKNAKVFYASQSILIGFEQYSKYLSKIQDYCYGKTSYAKSLVKRLEAYQNDPLRGFDVKSWIDLIFVYDVVILG
ncbi:hypothetical protein FJZ33_03450, partial [Candidatus Poribacteria bacterium]|nr:hypothetical protein [Candidatus Poribacteria bacterium]